MSIILTICSLMMQFTGLKQTHQPELILKSPECIIHDYLNFRSFDFKQYSDSNLTKGKSEKVIINICEAGIPLDELTGMCALKEGTKTKGIFFAFLANSRTKECHLFTKQDIDDIIFDKKLSQVSILISQELSKKKEIGGFEFLAYKLVLYEKVSKSKDPKHKYIKYLNRDSSDKYDRIYFQISDIPENQKKKIQVSDYLVTSINTKVLGITIPRLILILVLGGGYFCLHLDMKDSLYPLQHIMFAVNNIFIFLVFDGYAQIKSMPQSSILLIFFLIFCFFGTLSLKIKWIYRVTM